MRCSEIMTREYIICTPKSHLCDLRQKIGSQRYALVIDDAKPKGLVLGEVLARVRVEDRDDPGCIVERTLLPVSSCSADDSLCFVGARVLRDRSFAAVLYHDNILVGIAPLLEILHWLIAPPRQSAARP